MVFMPQIRNLVQQSVVLQKAILFTSIFTETVADCVNPHQMAESINSTLSIVQSQSSLTKSSSEKCFNRAKQWELHEICTLETMQKIKEIFGKANMEKLSREQFRVVLKECLEIEYDDDDYNILFLRMNANRDNVVTWDEFICHLLLGFFENDPDNERESLTLPIIGQPRIMKSHHRHPISRICFCPDVTKIRTTDSLRGMYITASRDGMINWWTLDMSLLRTAYSTSPNLKVSTTWITDVICMPDVNMIVTSSTEREVRFYDTAAKTFVLRLVISSWEYMICTMYYHFHQDTKNDNILLLGDIGGNIRILLFTPVLKGPFQNKPGKLLVKMRYVDLLRGKMPDLKLVEFKNIHTDWVRQIYYYERLHCFVSCATCPDALLMCDIEGTKTHTLFHITKGIQCFTIDEGAHALVTGGPDCLVRLWNPFVATKPSLVFQGHHAAVVAIVLQNAAQRIYSLSRDRVIKVWDVQDQNCMQTYVDLPSSLGERTPMSVVYNPRTREMFIAAVKIASVILDELVNAEHTDGFTHFKGVSQVLYNPLFKIVLTCGMDSIIISWDPITGKRKAMVREAHTRLLNGEVIPVEITAACFDPGYQLLITGARNGTLKVWNFNTGICLRNMALDDMCEVTSVHWIDNRILAVGWDRHVSEFEDSGTAVTGKSWERRHTTDVLAAAARIPHTLATASYSGELILWKLDTGQPIRLFSCMDPTTRIKIHYNKRNINKPSVSNSPRRRSTSMLRRASIHGQGKNDISDADTATKNAYARKVSVVKLPQTAQAMRSLAVHAMVFLRTRAFDSQVASLFVSLENGKIQAWSDHPAGGFKGSFQGIHTAGDYVSCLTTDQENMYLITGTTVGYIKIWLMQNYLVNEDVHVNMPKLRLQFPFMWRDRIEGRAKRSVRDQLLPLLCSSYRAHLRSVTGITYIDQQQFVVSGSSDCSVRLWKLSGEYLQTLGTFLPWNLDGGRHPPDIRRVASFTSLKVWSSGEVSRYVPGQIPIDPLKDITDEELQTKTFGVQITEPILGKYFKIPKQPERQDPVTLDTSMPFIPIYCHLRTATTQQVCRPPTPDLVKQNRLKKGALRKRGLHFQTVTTEYALAQEEPQQKQSDEKQTQ